MQIENPYQQNPNQPMYPQQNPYQQPMQNQYQQPPQVFNGQPVPNQAPKKSRRWIWIAVAVMVALFLACAGGVVAVVMGLSNSPARVAAQQYYDAMKSGDYSAAYSHLDPTMTLTVDNKSQQIDQQTFTTVAQAYDTQKGRVTDYSITGITISTGNVADITIKVTRNNTPYDVHLQLKQEGNDWKIISFDTL